ncbi:MAG: CoA ester lyase [Acidobacteriota bacterium]
MRSLLFVPGNELKKIQKAAAISADAFILDWEDSVLPSHRKAARELTRNFLLQNEHLQPRALLRINPAGSKDFELDCQALADLPITGILLSKCQSAQEVRCLAGVLDRSDAEGRIRVHALIESAAGILNAPQISSSCARMGSLAFGSEDYCADLGILRTPGDIELLFARSALVTAGRAFGLEVIDSPCLDLNDQAKLQREAQAARNLGFSGKLAIHPSQVPVLNQCFSPTETEIETAKRILAAFSSGTCGVLTVNGQMVDEAVLRRARQILKMS